MKKNHLIHYTPLIGILIAAVFGFVYVSYDIGFRVSLIIAASLAYISWGLVHHYIHKDLNLSVILEYISIAALGVIIGLSIIFRF